MTEGSCFPRSSRPSASSDVGGVHVSESFLLEPGLAVEGATRTCSSSCRQLADRYPERLVGHLGVVT